MLALASRQLLQRAALKRPLQSNIIRTQIRLNSQDKSSKSKATRSMSYGSPVTWKSVAVGGSIIVFTLGYLYKLKSDRQKQIDFNNKMTMGQADIKCLFDLVDTDGKKRTSEEFRGRWLLVYFGFTHCPDVCPEELEKLSEAIDRLHKEKFDITPLFITVDPQRDKPALMRKYLDEFSSKWIGLTGDDEQIGRTAKSFRVYYSPGPKDQDNDYIVDHTIISYLIGPKGQLMEYFGQTRTVDDVENLIKSHIMLYKD